MNLLLSELLFASTAAFVIGLSKSGIKGLGILSVTFMAIALGSKASTGIVLILLIAGDILAVLYYNRHAQWRLLFRFLPWMVAGVLVGVYFGKDLPEKTFKHIMAAIILVSAVMMLWWERKDTSKISNHILFAGSMGFLAGMTTMLGNLAGAFSNIFFLASRIPKDQFIGTAAWLYFIVNLVKLPFHIFSWKTINAGAISEYYFLLPVTLVGFYVGINIVKKFNESFFRKFVLAATILGAIFLFIK